MPKKQQRKTAKRQRGGQGEGASEPVSALAPIAPSVPSEAPVAVPPVAAPVEQAAPGTPQKSWKNLWGLVGGKSKKRSSKRKTSKSKSKK